MRETRTYGSEGGGAQRNGLSLPLSGKTKVRRCHVRREPHQVNNKRGLFSRHQN